MAIINNFEYQESAYYMELKLQLLKKMVPKMIYH